MGFRVSQGASVCSPDGLTVYRAGQMLPADRFTKKQIDAHKASGYIEEANEPTADKVVTGPPPGAAKMPPLPGLDSSDKDRARSDTVRVENSGTGVTSTTTNAEVVKQDKSLWVFDPEKLKGKTLDQLNTLIKETDPQAAPCATVDEAIAFLSMDFGK